MKDNEYLKSLSNGNPFHIFKIMRIIVFMLFIGINCAFSNTYSQSATFSLNLKDSSIKEVFNEIENNSVFVFLFSDEILQKLEQKVNIKVQSLAIEKILDKLFESTDLSYVIHDKQVLVT